MKYIFKYLSLSSLLISASVLAKSHSQSDSAANIIGYVLIAILFVVGVIVMIAQQNKLEDPKNVEVVYLEQIAALACFQEDQVFENSQKALTSAISTFKRAKIESVVISRNTELELSFRRLHHSHRGSNEGKKVGSARIVKIT
jgi:hypothetical protein